MRIITCFLVLCAHTLWAQKGTDHDKFARKFYQLYSYSEDKVETLLPDKAALEFVSQKTGASLDELMNRHEAVVKNLKKQLYDLSLKGNNKKNVIDNVSINVLEESPVKKADLVIYTHWGAEKSAILLHNCIRTDQGWYLGDFVGIEGETQAVANNRQVEEKTNQIEAWLADPAVDLKVLPEVHWFGNLVFGSRNGNPFYFFPQNPVPEAEGIAFAEFTLHKDGKYEGQNNFVKGPSKQISGVWKLEGNRISLSGTFFEIYHASTSKLILKDADGMYSSYSNHDAAMKASSNANAGSGTQVPKPWTGPDFHALPGQPYTQYVNPELIGKPVRGFYIDQGGNKREAVIKYQEPELLATATSALLLYKIAYNESGYTEDETSNFYKPLLKDSVVAFSMAGQVYVPVQLSARTWGILRKEGAIRQVVVISKTSNGPQTGYLTGTILDKLEGKKENIASMMLSFKSSMADLVTDHKELADKIRAKTEGYRMLQVEKIAAEYNEWYDKQYPGKVKYLFNEDGSVAWKPAK